MAKAPAKKRAPAKPRAKASAKTATRKAPTKPKAPAKPKSPTDEFIYNTPLEKIEAALKRLEEQDADPMAEPLTKDQIYWWVVWENQLPEAKRRGLTQVPTCAIEGAVLGLYDKTATRKRK